MSNSSLPANVYVSKHPCILAKLSQLRSQSTTSARDVKALVHEIAIIAGCEALGFALESTASGMDQSPLGYDYETSSINPSSITLVPILRSGLGMVDALMTLLPNPVSIHHLGLFREPTTLSTVEYYNNLPSYHPASTSTSTSNSPPTPSHDPPQPQLAIILDPIIATGNTALAAIQTLKEWGVPRIIMISILGSVEGVRRAAMEWPEGVNLFVGALDAQCDGKGMIMPGLGDVGDRLFLAKGK